MIRYPLTTAESPYQLWPIVLDSALVITLPVTDFLGMTNDGWPSIMGWLSSPNEAVFSAPR